MLVTLTAAGAAAGLRWPWSTTTPQEIFRGRISALESQAGLDTKASFSVLAVFQLGVVPLELAESDNPLGRLSDRQRETAVMLADGLTDEQIAQRLEVSVRTVRYDVAKLGRLLQTSSRFGIGLALGRLGFDHHGDGRDLDPVSG